MTASLSWITILLLVYAAWRDLTTRTIPNAVSIAIVAVGLATRGAEGSAAVEYSLLVAVVMFLALVPLHHRGVLGGADVKLLSALAVGLSPLASYRLISAVALLGGVLAAIYLGLRRLMPPAAIHASTSGRDAFSKRFLAIEAWRIRRGAALPYGIAIAAGAALVVFGQTGV